MSYKEQLNKLIEDLNESFKGKSLKEGQNNKGKEMRIGIEEYDGEFHVTVFGGTGYSRDGKLFQQSKYYKKFNTKEEAEKYAAKLKKELKYKESLSRLDTLHESVCKEYEYQTIRVVRQFKDLNNNNIPIGKYLAVIDKTKKTISLTNPMNNKTYVAKLDESTYDPIYMRKESHSALNRLYDMVNKESFKEKQSVTNEEVIDRLVKIGQTKDKATRLVKKHLDYVNRVYSGQINAKIAADIMMTLG